MLDCDIAEYDTCHEGNGWEMGIDQGIEGSLRGGITVLESYVRIDNWFGWFGIE